MSPGGSHGEAIRSELAAAEAALAAGNEGRARVCARRAAGIALREHYRAAGAAGAPAAAQSLLHVAAADPALPASVREAAVRLTTSVTRRSDAPFTADPAGDARIIIGALGSGAGNPAGPEPEPR